MFVAVSRDFAPRLSVFDDDDERDVSDDANLECVEIVTALIAAGANVNASQSTEYSVRHRSTTT